VDHERKGLGGGSFKNRKERKSKGGYPLKKAYQNLNSKKGNRAQLTSSLGGVACSQLSQKLNERGKENYISSRLHNKREKTPAKERGGYLLQEKIHGGGAWNRRSLRQRKNLDVRKILIQLGVDSKKIGENISCRKNSNRMGIC